MLVRDLRRAASEKLEAVRIFSRRQSEGQRQPAVAKGLPVKATDSFKQVVRDRWAPILREEGLKGSGRVFVLPDDRDWAMLGFQSSTSSNAEWVKFTMNLLVAGKDEYEDARTRASYLGERPSPNVVGGPHRYLERIGHLTHGADHWWYLRANEDNAALILEISTVLRDVAVPTLREQMADRSPGPRGTFERRNPRL